MDTGELKGRRSPSGRLSSAAITMTASGSLSKSIPSDVTLATVDQLRSGLSSLSDPDVERSIRDDERNHVARELHDSTSQLLVALDLHLMRLKVMPSATGSGGFSAVVDELEHIVAELHRSVRALAEPQRFEPKRLSAELAAMAAEFEVQTGIAVETSFCDLPAATQPAHAAALYRVGQEALANACRHGKARKAKLSVAVDARSLILRVTDDGVGFAPPPRGRPAGCGIANMMARMDELGGSLTIRKLAVGTLVEASIELVD